MIRGKTSAAGRGGLRFALLSIRRGGLRSLAVPLVSLALTVTVLSLGSLYQRWQNELDDALENRRIEGMAASLNGRYYAGLSLSVNAVRTLLGTGGVDGVSVSWSYHFWLPEDMPPFNSGDSGVVRRNDWIAVQPELVALNELAAAEEFYYADPAVTWLEGWDETMLAETEVTPVLLRSSFTPEETRIPAVCSAAFPEEHGMALGDDFACRVQYERIGRDPVEIPVLLQVVGSYAQASKAHIYVPLAFHVPMALLTGAGTPANVGEEQQQRVAVARAPGMETKVLLADEPTGNLDFKNGEMLFGILEDLAHRDGHCAVIVTHDEALRKRADEILRLRDGEFL